MMTRYPIRLPRLGTLWGAGLVCALIFAIGLVLKPSIERIFLLRLADSGQATLNIAVEGLHSTLERFEPLAKLIAERPILVRLLNEPTNSGLLPFVNEQLRMTALSLGVSDVYLMDIGGDTIAASNYRKDITFIGNNFAYRPYFQQALEGGLGRFFAHGTTSGQRGYFFAAPVIDQTRVAGVLVVKFLVDPFEASWQGGGSEIIVTDRAGVIFMSSRPEWQFRLVGPIESEAHDRIAATRQYPMERLVPLDAVTTEIGDGLTQVTVEGEDFLAGSTFLSEVGWRVHLLTRAGPARTEALIVLLALGLAALLLVLATSILVQRRVRAREREEERQADQEELERQVRHRTADLNEVNTRLLNEIEERRATEERLRSTQKELVQAGKLAALGQMSAALSHEINQPLAAVKSYAENAAAYLDRKRFAEARENVTRISQMADRMATLSGHLRNFARRPQDTVGPVDVSIVLDDAVDLMAPRLANAGAKVERSQESRKQAFVNGGRIRLQQVFVNLISNALDAMENDPAPRIMIDRSEAGKSRTRVTVRDFGPGLENGTVGRIFDPFFTTKEPGKGLGLGLSISYNIVEDFGGRLSAANAPDGAGAVFAVELTRAAGCRKRARIAAE